MGGKSLMSGLVVPIRRNPRRMGQPFVVETEVCKLTFAYCLVGDVCVNMLSFSPLHRQSEVRLRLRRGVDEIQADSQFRRGVGLD